MVDAKRKNALTHEMVAGASPLTRWAGTSGSAPLFWPDCQRSFQRGWGFEVLDELATGRRMGGEILLPRVLLDCPVPGLAAMAGYGLGDGFALGVAADVELLGR
jgi:enoyl-CoA hydratase/carnithine racemase